MQKYIKYKLSVRGRWNYRFVNTPSENEGEDWFALKEVYYGADDEPIGYSEPCTGMEKSNNLRWLINRWREAEKAPTLHEDEFK